MSIELFSVSLTVGMHIPALVQSGIQRGKHNILAGYCLHNFPCLIGLPVDHDRYKADNLHRHIQQFKYSGTFKINVDIILVSHILPS
jgi:hypothetical protein